MITVEMLQQKVDEAQNNKRKLVAQLNFAEGLIQGYIDLIATMTAEPVEEGKTEDKKK